MSLRVTGLTPGDRGRWTELWQAYLAFYETVLDAEVYDCTWSRLLDGREIHGLAARTVDNEIVGITHYLFHAHSWTTARACYLQDLFVDPAERRHGAARLLIEAVGRYATEAGADRLYWNTQAGNATARRLYDRVAEHRGFIRYDYTLR